MLLINAGPLSAVILVTHVRFGEIVYLPFIEKGQADIILALKRLEALRWAEHLNPKGNLVVNDREIPPPCRLSSVLRNIRRRYMNV